MCCRGSPLWLGRHREHGRGGANPGGVGRGSAPGGGGGGLSSCALGGRHCGWEYPFRALLCPQGSASIGRSGGVQNTDQGTGTAWSREPRIPPSVGTFSELPNLAVAEKPRLWGQGLYRSTTLLKNLRDCKVFPSSLLSAGSPRDRTLNSGRLDEPCFWHFVGQWALEHLLGWEREGSANCTLVAAQAAKKGGGHLAALSWQTESVAVLLRGPFHGDLVQ